jgi:hypothetical protein
LSKEKQVKLLKIDFPRNTFFRCSARLPFGSSPVAQAIEKLKLKKMCGRKKKQKGSRKAC